MKEQEWLKICVGVLVVLQCISGVLLVRHEQLFEKYLPSIRRMSDVTQIHVFPRPDGNFDVQEIPPQ